jgi:hypothetical protein
MALFVKDLFWKKEFWVFLFIIGAVLLNWPVLTIVAGKYILDVPATLVYVAAIWLLIIIIAYLFDRGPTD